VDYNLALTLCRRTRKSVPLDFAVRLQAMLESAYLPGIAIQNSPRHSALVRLTHWINSFSFFALVVSGVAILIAHPRLYWGETGAVGMPSLFDLPIPFMLGHSGWGRYLHFLAAWVCILNGLIYALSGFLTQHFRKHLVTRRGAEESYNILQRLAYTTVVFLLFPLIIVTGLAMSPAITSVIPALVDVFGGQQSARTIHFFVANLLVLFFFVHIVMVSLAGFTNPVRAMITGRASPRKESS
jgi:thiosulfate reductase cytochrome b subunit